MKLSDVLLLGLKKRVTAIERSTGEILWETRLKGGSGEFVTVLCDGELIFASAGGHLHCLDFHSGQVLWSNSLPGYGYGVATLCLPDSGLSAPSAAALDKLLQDERAATQAASTNATTV